MEQIYPPAKAELWYLASARSSAVTPLEKGQDNTKLSAEN